MTALMVSGTRSASRSLSGAICWAADTAADRAKFTGGLPSIFVDWNQNGTFEANELVVSSFAGGLATTYLLLPLLRGGPLRLLREAGRLRGALDAQLRLLMMDELQEVTVPVIPPALSSNDARWCPR